MGEILSYASGRAPVEVIYGIAEARIYGYYVLMGGWAIGEPHRKSRNWATCAIR